MQLALHACLLALVLTKYLQKAAIVSALAVALCIFQEVQLSKHTGYVLQVVPCLALHDTMRHIKSDVVTVGFGGCMGMSGFLLAVGKKVCCFLRFVSQSETLPRSCITIRGFSLAWVLTCALDFRANGMCCQTRES